MGLVSFVGRVSPYVNGSDVAEWALCCVLPQGCTPATTFYLLLHDNSLDASPEVTDRLTAMERVMQASYAPPLTHTLPS